MFGTLPKTGRKEESFKYLAEANEKSDWIWKIYAKCMIGTFLNVALMSILSVVACLVMNGRFDTKYLFHPFKIM